MKHLLAIRDLTPDEFDAILELSEGSPGRALSPIWVWAALTFLVLLVGAVKWLEAFMGVMQQYGTYGY